MDLSGSARTTIPGEGRPAADAGAGRGRAPTLLLDTSSLMYRAFFSVPRSIVDGDGRPVNALRGYLDFTSALIASRRPCRVVHCLDDDWRPAPRVAAYPGYKAGRAPDPDGLPDQFDVLVEVLGAAGMPVAHARGWEAEDAIGSLAAPVSGDERVENVTGDRDLIQLVRDPHVVVLFTVKGVSELRVLDEAGVVRKYAVPASRYADFAILRGDPSDGLPGVRGVGEKTARDLVAAYPSLDALVADATAERRTGRILQRSPALRTSIREAAGYLEAMTRVVPIRTELRVRVREEKPDDERLGALASRHNLEGPVRRLRAAIEGMARPAGAL